MRPNKLVVGLLVGLSLVIVLRIQQRKKQADDPQQVERNSQASTTIPDNPGVTQPSLPNVTREPLAPDIDTSFSGVVCDELGPVTGAQVSLVSVAVEDWEMEGAWHDDDWGRIDRESRWMETDSDGRFSFRDPAESSTYGIVIWATHPQHRAGALLLESDRASWPKVRRVFLEQSRPMIVSVRDALGQPIAGAQVDQFGLVPVGAATHAGLTEERARRLLHRTASTSEDGAVALGAFPGEQVLIASTDELCSVPWRGTQQDAVTLTLAPAFEVGGEVRMPSWDHLNYIGERRITIAAQRKNLWRTLYTIRSVQSGPWGPITLPVLDVDRYRVRLEGSPIIPVEAHFEPPPAGTRLKHDLITDLGVDLYFRVANEEDRVIESAIVKVQWQDSDNPDHWNFVERGVNDKGQINVWSVPPGMMMFEASAPGYVTVRSGLEATSSYEENYCPIVLKRAARLKGRCIHDGQPVKDFEIIVWQTADRGSSRSTSFFDRGDGSFELDEVPEGPFWITAASGQHPGCRPRQLTTQQGQTLEVEIELPAALVGVGQVVDEETGEPLSDASIQLFIEGDIIPIARWGLPQPVKQDGTFEIEGFIEGANHVRVSAPGHSRKIVEGTAVAGEFLDWGTITLSRSHSLSVELYGGTSDYRSITASGRGQQALPARRFDSDGEVRFEDVSAGLYQIEIDEKETSTSLVVDLPPGKDWNLRHRIAGARYLTVEVLAEDKAELAALTLDVTYQSEEGYRVRRTKGPIRDGLLQVEGIDGSAVQAELYDAQGTTVASARGTFVGDSLHLTIPLGGEPFSLRVVDPDGQPIPDVKVTVGDRQRPELVQFGGTDSNGECRFEALPSHEVLVNLRHGSKGSRYGVPIDTSDGHEELVLDARGILDVIIEDGNVPIPGVTCSLVDEAGNPLQHDGQTDDAGRLRIPQLAEGDYHVKARKSDCWPVDFTAPARIEGDPFVVQMRRLGSLDLEVVAPGGLPVANLGIQLSSVEFDTGVAAWISEGWVESSGLSTDLRGRVRVGGLPRGAYSWRIEIPGRDPLDGELEVGAGAAATHRILLHE